MQTLAELQLLHDSTKVPNVTKQVHICTNCTGINYAQMSTSLIGQLL